VELDRIESSGNANTTICLKKFFTMIRFPLSTSTFEPSDSVM
jgi:hypothetical protein